MHHTDRNAHRDRADTARMPTVRMRPRKRDTGLNVLAVATTLIALAGFFAWLAR